MYHPLYGDIDPDDADLPHVVGFPQTTPVARRPHRCDLCGGKIGAGERYVRDVAVVDGDVVTQRFHDHPCLPTPDALAALLGEGHDLPF